MHQFTYKDGFLHAEDVNLHVVAEEYGTPLYVYSAGTIRQNYLSLQGALADLDHEIAYAVKANSNLSVINALRELGSSFDIVSGGELFRVIKAGGDPRKCTFAGVGKTEEEIRYALESDIYCFNVESEEELIEINRIAEMIGKTAPIAVRVNPNVDAKTHKYISTGKSENKFGVDFESIEGVYERASRLKHISLKGLQMHIGSQLTQVTPFIEAVQKVTPLAKTLKKAYGIEFFSIGGGIGIVYEEALASGTADWWEKLPIETRPLTPTLYAEKLLPTLKSCGLKILLEPGRFMVGNAGVMLTKCLYEKKGKAKTFKIVDGAMNDLIRPALYEGHHEIVPVIEHYEKTALQDVVGPVCESGDFFCQERELPDIQTGDYIALMSAGAYGFAMASNYNTRPFPAQLMIDGDQVKVIKPRQLLEELLEDEIQALQA